MTNSLKLSAEARADHNKEMERLKEEQQARIDVTVDEWMQDEAMVENAMLEAIKEVSGDMALLLAEAEKEINNVAFSKAADLRLKAVMLLLNQTYKELEEQAEEHLFS